MKQQTSLEFLMIAGAISVLILFAIMQYGTIINQYKGVPNVSLDNYSVPENPVYYQKPYLEASMPAVSSSGYQNELNLATYGCANGTISISLSSANITFSTYNLTERFYNVWTYQDGFAPSAGLNRARLTYKISCSGSVYNGSEEMSTVYSHAVGQLPYSAYLSGRNESIDYAAQKQEIMALGTSSHCTYENFFYSPYPIQDQCGTTDAWQYLVSTAACASNGGPGTETVCVNPEESGYNISTTSQYQTEYVYTVNLTIAGTYALNSRILSSSKKNPVYYDGQPAGNASVENVTSSQGNPNIVLISGLKTGYVNYTYVSEYDQAENNLDSLLAFYNSSDVSSSVYSEIQQVVSSYDNSETKLITESNNATQIKCTMESNSIMCPAEYPFYYVINATISPKYLSGNQVVSYEGSTIKVFD